MMSSLLSVFYRPAMAGMLSLGLFFFSSCSKEEKTSEEVGKPKSMDQLVFDTATKAFAKVLVGTWVVGLPKSHPQYDPSKVSKDTMEYEFTAENTGYMSVGNMKSIFVYSVSGKVITLNLEGAKEPLEVKFSLLSEDMISLEMQGSNMIFARKGK